MLRRMADYLACPRCGERVDENPTTRDKDTIPSAQMELIGGRRAEFVFCPHCGAVLGVLDPK
jgi:hypothetical protein